MCIRPRLDFEKNVKRGLYILYFCYIVVAIERQVFQELVLHFDFFDEIGSSFGGNVLIVSGLCFCIVSAVTQSYIDIKLSHFLYILQVKELRWTLMYAQGASAIFTTVFYAMYIGTRNIIDCLNENWIAINIIVYSVLFVVITTHIFFLIKSIRAAKAISGNELTIDLILRSNEKQKEIIMSRTESRTDHRTLSH